MKRYIFIFILSLYYHLTIYSQDSIKEKDTTQINYWNALSKKGVSIGFNRSPNSLHGIKLNIIEQTSYINGISVTAINTPLDFNENYINGITANLFFGDLKSVNGISISPVFQFIEDDLNGISIGGFSDIDKMNGLSINSLVQLSDITNGVSIAGIDITSFTNNGVSIAGVVNRIDNNNNGIMVGGIWAGTEANHGLMIGGIGTKAKHSQGVQIGLFNFSEQLQGIQLGLINNIKQNKKWCRTLPFINFNTKKYYPRIDTINNMDTVIIITYQIDNQTIVSVESYLKEKDSTYNNLTHNGRCLKYDGKSRLIEETNFKNDSIISKTTTQYISKRNYNTTYTENLITKTYSIYKKDTINRSINKPGYSWHYEKSPFNSNPFYESYYETENGKEISSAIIYKGRDIDTFIKKIGKIKLKKGDTLNQSVPENFFHYNTGDGFWSEETDPIFKEDVVLYLDKKCRIKGYAYESSKDSLYTILIFYNWKRKKLYYEAEITDDKIVYKKHFRNGRIKEFYADETFIKQNKRGQIILKSQYENNIYITKKFKKGRITEIEQKNYSVSFYKSGTIKKEFIGSNKMNYVEKYYWKNGKLKEERCFDENFSYKYNKKGILIKIEEHNYKPEKIRNNPVDSFYE